MSLVKEALSWGFNSVSEGGLEPSAPTILVERESGQNHGLACGVRETSAWMLTVAPRYTGLVQPPGARMILTGPGARSSTDHYVAATG
jgi:hypothetical protein